ncbi:hypothetical protein BS50DRAFT_586184 [Corynespora cassiicola Philippines]|uniref:Uncharacterized protein n=1 Tax=Corynespora cassiicola Philippines TaxID=1448308 RepID=A0A2T2NTP1_CORCC|nr:hypothetical protein BS50DRAFT_586184 [Corynespora cassiicola Philippines]
MVASVISILALSSDSEEMGKTTSSDYDVTLGYYSAEEEGVQIIWGPITYPAEYYYIDVQNDMYSICYSEFPSDVSSTCTIPTTCSAGYIMFGSTSSFCAGDDQCFTDILYSSMGDINGTTMIYCSVKRDGKQATTLVYGVLPSSGIIRLTSEQKSTCRVNECDNNENTHYIRHSHPAGISQSRWTNTLIFSCSSRSRCSAVGGTVALALIGLVALWMFGWSRAPTYTSNSITNGETNPRGKRLPESASYICELPEHISDLSGGHSARDSVAPQSSRGP